MHTKQEDPIVEVRGRIREAMGTLKRIHVTKCGTGSAILEGTFRAKGSRTANNCTTNTGCFPTKVSEKHT